MAKKELKYKTWEEIERALEELAYIKNTLIRAEAQKNRQVLEINSAFDERTAEERKRAKELADNIRKFAKANIKDFGDRKSKSFSHGEIKFTQSARITIPDGKEADILQELRSRDMEDCIIIDERINKDVLKTYTEATVNAVGAKLKAIKSCKVITLDEEGHRFEN